MTTESASTIHASAVLVGAKAVLIRGPAGSGKSQLVWHIIASRGVVPFARLVADDRAYVTNAAGRLVVRPAPALAGMIEIRGLGIRRIEFESMAVVGWVIDLAADDAERYPGADAMKANIAGVILPRLAVAAGQAPLPLLLASLQNLSAGD